MPEGPEVYVMTKKLMSFKPKLLIDIETCHDRYHNKIPKIFNESLPLEILEIYSIGKKTVIEFKDKLAVLISYGMSGHWEKKPSKFAQIKFTFDTIEYFWVSARNLPTCSVEFLTRKQLIVKLERIGPDIIKDKLSNDEILAIFNSNKNIRVFLLDQTYFSGIGNYLVAATLYRCKISPHKRVNELTNDQKIAVWEMAKKVAKEAIAANGMGIRDYKNDDGDVVGVNFDITPYNMSVDQFDNKVISEKIAGRMCWWVPTIQIN